ncbi:MAG: IS3 family transposase [Bacteroidota bacterium]
MIYGLIKKLSEDYPIGVLCKILSVSKSAYYDFVGGKSWSDSAYQQSLKAEVKSIFEEHKRRYGSRRIVAELRARGFNVGRDRIRSLMKQMALVAIQPKSFIPRTTRSDPSNIRSPNLLLGREELCQKPREILVGDITYWPAEEGWLYLATWMDLYSRRILGWKLEQHMEASLVVDAFKKVLLHGELPEEIIIHSDGGGQYKSLVFRGLLQQSRARQSMTRIDNHYDNAFIESLFSRVKAEMMDEFPYFKSKQEGQIRLFEYIDGYYNTKRRHSSIAYLSPIEYENRFEEGSLR